MDAIGKLDALLNVLLERANVTVQDSKMPNEVNTSSPDRTQSINNMVMRNELTQNHEGSVPSLLPDKPGYGFLKYALSALTGIQIGHSPESVASNFDKINFNCI